MILEPPIAGVYILFVGNRGENVRVLETACCILLDLNGFLSKASRILILRRNS